MRSSSSHVYREMQPVDEGGHMNNTTADAQQGGEVANEDADNDAGVLVVGIFVGKAFFVG